MQTFEDYLKEQYNKWVQASNFNSFTDYNEWIKSIGINTVLAHGTAYGATQYSLALKDANKMINQYLK